ASHSHQCFAAIVAHNCYFVWLDSLAEFSVILRCIISMNSARRDDRSKREVIALFLANETPECFIRAHHMIVTIEPYERCWRLFHNKSDALERFLKLTRAQNGESQEKAQNANGDKETCCSC